MIHPSDVQSIQRLIGKQEVPDDILLEYEIRIRMWHRDGHSGPLGTLPLIDLVRALKYEPPRDPPIQASIDWGKKPQDGSVKCDVFQDGRWKPAAGCFVGFVSNGILAIRMPDRYVREFRKCDVRPAFDDADKTASDFADGFTGASLWFGMAAGTKVCVVIDGEVKNGTFQRPTSGTNLVVLVDGQEYVVDEEDASVE